MRIRPKTIHRLLILFCIALVLVGALTTWLLISQHRMRGQIFNNASKIYARPRVLRVGQSARLNEIINQLRIAGYIVKPYMPANVRDKIRSLGF